MPGNANVKIDELLAFVRGDVDEFETLEVERVLRHFGLVVKLEYRRLQIGTELFKTMECIAKMFSIPAATFLLSGTASETFSAELGCTLFNEVQLMNYLDENGQNIFPVVDPNSVVQYGYIKYS